MSSLMDSEELRRKLEELPATLAGFVTTTDTRDVLLKLVFGSVASLATYGVYKLLAKFYKSFTSPLRILPGPPNDSYIFGNLIQIRDADAAAIHVKWGKEYGPVVQYKAWLSVSAEALCRAPWSQKVLHRNRGFSRWILRLSTISSHTLWFTRNRRRRGSISAGFLGMECL